MDGRKLKAVAYLIEATIFDVELPHYHVEKQICCDIRIHTFVYLQKNI